MELSGREKALLSRGYKEEDIVRLSNFTKEELDFAVEVGFSRISAGVYPVDNPIAVFVGGQPGSGKSTETKRIKEKINNIIDINLDIYRSYHPRYLEIEKMIKDHWKNRPITDQDAPGNDLADFTHKFVSDISDALIEKSSELQEGNKRFNMVIEWGMRDVTVPLQTMQDLKDKGYINSVRYVCVYKETSYEACILRSEVMNDNEHIVRRIPKSFHDLYINTLPDGVNEMYEKGYKTGIINELVLTLRKGEVVWDTSNTTILPGDVYREYLNNPELTKEFVNDSSLAKENSLSEIAHIVR